MKVLRSEMLLLLALLCAGSNAQAIGTYSNSEAPTLGIGANVPDTQTVLCPLTGVFPKSETLFNKITSVTFENTSDEPMALFWVNTDGIEVAAGMIPPQGHVRHNTRFGHVFRVKNKFGQVVMAHKAGMTPIRNDALLYTESPDPPPDYKPATRRDYQRKPTGYVAGWRNNAGFYLDLFHYRDGQTRDRIGQMRTGAFFFEYTYHNHEFLAKTPDGRVVAHRKMGNTQVIDCPSKVPQGIGIKLLPHGAINIDERYGVYIPGGPADDMADDRICKDALKTMEYETFINKVDGQNTCNRVEIVKEADEMQIPGGKIKILRDVFLLGVMGTGHLSVSGSVLV